MSKKQFPTRFTILAAEDLRSEGGDKFSIMGLAPSGLPVIGTADNLLIPSLAIYANFFGLAGEFDARLSVENDGKRLFETPVPAATSVDDSSGDSDNDGENVNILIAGKFMNVKVTKPDKIKVTIRLDDKEYTQSFRLALTSQDVA